MGTQEAQKGGNGTQGGRGGVRGARCIALIGPFASGKTTLLEAILARTDDPQEVLTVLEA